MLKIYLARHGQNLDNVNGLLNGWRDEPLSDLGRDQAQELADSISKSKLKFIKVYSSPLSRAYDTAKTISDKLNIESPEINELLIERNFGDMTGKPQNTIEQECSPDILKTDTVTYFLSPNGAETFPDLIIRAKKLISFLESKHGDGNILLVSHGDFGKMIYCAYYNLDWKEVLKMFHFGNSDLILMSPESDPNEVHVFKFDQHNL